MGKLTNSWAKSWGGGPTVNLIITSSLSIQYKEKQPFTVFQTPLQNTLILSYLYQCDKQKTKFLLFSCYPLPSLIVCVSVCVWSMV